jgi:hypothetical protein
MHTDKAIAEFEAWWLKQIWHECFEDVKDQMRNVWLASRRELVIELPRSPRAYPPNEASSDVDYWIDEAKWDMWAGCKRAIEAAGVTVRG